MSVDKTQFLNCQVPLQPIHTQWLSDSGVKLDMLRLDLLDSQVSGNKWYKLKQNLKAAREQGKNTILSFGGVWSNHIHALAAAGNRFGFSTIGVIRSEPIKEHGRLTLTLEDAVKWGMTLRFLSRSDYRKKNDPEFLNRLMEHFGLQYKNVHLVPEGGSNDLGIKGCEEIFFAGDIQSDVYNEVWLACGTGVTLSGIALSADAQSPTTHIKGVAVLKGADFLRNDINRFTHRPLDNWTLLTEYHHGGYARTSKELLAFMQYFEQETGITLDPVYTGKAMFALYC
ncbi:MAG: 1-aminocyclopropane-1-carboxylate deaminase/D-cysteine desulfhydrase, partial [Endozoicomonas sp.]